MTLAINHPGMSKVWFDNAVKRAMDAELCVQGTSRASVGAVSSATDPDVSYLVTREACSCKAGVQLGRCYHRALWIAWLDVWSTVDLGAAMDAGDDQTA